MENPFNRKEPVPGWSRRQNRDFEKLLHRVRRVSRGMAKGFWAEVDKMEESGYQPGILDKNGVVKDHAEYQHHVDAAVEMRKKYPDCDIAVLKLPEQTWFDGTPIPEDKVRFHIRHDDGSPLTSAHQEGREETEQERHSLDYVCELYQIAMYAGIAERSRLREQAAQPQPPE